MSLRRLFYASTILTGFFTFINIPLVQAVEPSFDVRQAVVLVHCGDRQGSGIVVNGDKGYVLTNAHVLLNLKTTVPSDCEVGFITDPQLPPSTYYDADYVEYIFDEDNNLDFAILKIGRRLRGQSFNIFPFLKTDEFSKVGDPLAIISYPGTAKGKQVITNGTINGLEQGIVKTDAMISAGSSGGAGVDTSNNLVGMATRILYIDDGSGVETLVDYELVDIRGIINWMDTFGVNAHDEYVVHADYDRYHKASTYLEPTTLSCSFFAKSILSSTVYCMKNDGTRQSFPNDATYASWFSSDFSAVQTTSLEQLAQYRLTKNITMKPGTLIKVTTDPRVYVVSNIAGALRWITSESKARELYGDGWAGFVKDVPDTFFTNYTVGETIE